jgi:hypothetical protein
VPVGLLCATVEALEGQRPWLCERQVERLRRAERRYHRYGAQRPRGAPANAAAVLVALASARPAKVAAPLPWAIAQLDLLSKRMRRADRRVRAGERLAHAGRRAERRRRRREREASSWFRRRGAERRRQVDGRVGVLADAVLDRSLHTTLRYALLELQDELVGRGIAVTGGQLREELRDELHRRGAGMRELCELDGAFHAAPPPAVFNPTGPQVTERDRLGLLERPWVKRRRALAEPA